MHRNSESTSTKLQRIAELAKQNREMAFTSLNHLLDMKTLTRIIHEPETVCFFSEQTLRRKNSMF